MSSSTERQEGKREKKKEYKFPTKFFLPPVPPGSCIQNPKTLEELVHPYSLKALSTDQCSSLNPSTEESSYEEFVSHPRSAKSTQQRQQEGTRMSKPEETPRPFTRVILFCWNPEVPKRFWVSKV